ncbi:lipid-transfer protein [Mycolicibacterium fortuitum]|uniref:Lipid-transfer protein n=1 Tax=Mycolicibacterium fortuitum TaxID=1766 RepID=A0A378UY59_MYCFO|nr:lipid-transfer protein [Mycolicibacterium fortuitum]
MAYRAFNERSEFRFGQVMTGLTVNADSRGVEYSWSYPHGLSTPAASVAMIAQRYMHEYGATSADFGVVSVADRKHAATNPKAFFYGKPSPSRITRTRGGSPNRSGCWTAARRATGVSPSSSRPPSGPRISSTGRRSSRRRPGCGHRSVHDVLVLPRRTRTSRDGSGRTPALGQSGLSPATIQTAILYDHFTPYTLLQLEELGFCGKGEAKDFIAGGAIELAAGCRSTPTEVS